MSYERIQDVADTYGMTLEQAAQILWNKTSFPFVPRGHDWGFVVLQIENLKYYYGFKGTWRD